MLWDLDGTLLDTEHLWLDAERRTMAAHGSTWTEADQRHCLGGPLERVAQYMADRIPDGTTPERLALELLDAMEDLLRRGDPQWRPGAVELVADLRRHHVPLALVTASHRRLLAALDATLEDSLAQHIGGTAPVFAVTVAGDEVDVTKPHPEPYLTAAARLGVDITRCVVIEDSPTGVRSGVDSGALVVAVPHIAVIADTADCRVLDTLVGLRTPDLGRWLDERGSRAGSPVPSP